LYRKVTSRRLLVRRTLLNAAALVLAGVATLAIAGYALAHYPIEAPMTTRVHHDDFAFVVRSVEYGSQLEGSRDVYIHLSVENDARVVGYRWEPATAYLIDGAGRRYLPGARNSTPSATIAAGNRADETLVFQVPPDAHDLRLAFWDGVMMGDVFDGLRYARLRLRLDS
jgi:hypothetical protein